MKKETLTWKKAKSIIDESLEDFDKAVHDMHKKQYFVSEREWKKTSKSLYQKKLGFCTLSCDLSKETLTISYEIPVSLEAKSELNVELPINDKLWLFIDDALLVAVFARKSIDSIEAAK
jgi:hypothetical protein